MEITRLQLKSMLREAFIAGGIFYSKLKIEAPKGTKIQDFDHWYAEHEQAKPLQPTEQLKQTAANISGY